MELFETLGHGLAAGVARGAIDLDFLEVLVHGGRGELFIPEESSELIVHDGLRVRLERHLRHGGN